MEIVIDIAIAFVYSGMIIEMIMSAKIDSTTFGCYAFPESVPFIRIIIEAVFVKNLECRFMAEDKDVRLSVVMLPIKQG